MLEAVTLIPMRNYFTTQQVKKNTLLCFVNRINLTPKS